MDDDLFEEEAELPIIDDPIVGPLARAMPRRRPRERPKGNTPIAAAGEARRAAVAEATGHAPPSAEVSWREHLGNRDRGKAISELTSGKPTHNSDKGFGLATGAKPRPA